MTGDLKGEGEKAITITSATGMRDLNVHPASRASFTSLFEWRGGTKHMYHEKRL